MTVLIGDGFDHYTTIAQMLLKGWYNNPYGTVQAGRFGGGCAAIGDGQTRSERSVGAAKGTLIAGMAFKNVSLNTSIGYFKVFSFLDGTTIQMQLRFDVTINKFKLYRGDGTTLLATGTTTIPQGAWAYVEVKVVFATTAVGSAIVRINGVDEFNLATIVTVISANATADVVSFRSIDANGNYGTYYIDDLYVCDSLGAQNNNFLGDCRISTLLPSAAGATTAWTPTPATNNYSRVNEATPDDDTSYVASATVGQVDTYAMADLPSTGGAIKAVLPTYFARKDDAGVRTIAPVLRIGGVDYVQANLPNLGAAYQYLPQVIELSPATAVAFTIAEVNGMEAGVKMIA